MNKKSMAAELWTQVKESPFHHPQHLNSSTVYFNFNFLVFFIDVWLDLLSFFLLSSKPSVPSSLCSFWAALPYLFLLALAGSRVFNEPVRDNSTNIPSH